MLRPVAAAIAAICGWRIVGNRAGTGIGNGISNGITATISAVFLSVSVFAIAEMFDRSLHRRYRNVIEAIGDTIKIGVDYATDMAHAPVLMALVVGAVVTGFAGEFIQRRWR